MRTKLNFLFLLIALTGLYCKQKRSINRDTSITDITAFNNLFFDSVKLIHFLDQHHEFEKYREQYFDFYKQRNYQYAWFDKQGLAEQSDNFINLLNTSFSTLHDSVLIHPQLEKLFQKNKDLSLKKMEAIEGLQTELLLTGQFFVYAATVYKGGDVNAEELGWFIPRKKVDLKHLLDTAILLKARQTETIMPLNDRYYQLQKTLAAYFKMETLIGNDTIPKVDKKIKKGDTSTIIPALRKRLYLTGDLSKLTDTTSIYDSVLSVAVKQFQIRMGLPADAVVNNKFITEINVPVKKRIQQILVNMERARWLPPEKDSNYIVVNIPEYKMSVYDSSKKVFDMNVIVGKSATSTVIFNNNLRYIVFSPYWKLPKSIVEKEVIPGMKRDGNYLSRNGMEITGTEEGVPTVRQNPGPKNSLGLVKFLFPNNYDIYFHDTPNRELFNSTDRSFSHGCIRLGEPKKLAEYLLRKDTSFNSEKIDSLMHLSKEKWVNLPKPIPVFIIYFTAWVDKSGLLNFRKDIYGHDAKMEEKMFVK